MIKKKGLLPPPMAIKWCIRLELYKNYFTDHGYTVTIQYNPNIFYKAPFKKINQTMAFN